MIQKNYTDEEIEKQASQHGITHEEYQKVLNILGRTPNLVEIGVFSVMWSEHCSYKSTRVHLKKLHTKGDIVICGPGENAGVIDIGDGQAAIFKMESHNHPSYIEPYQGAATGVGGILRDVFTMGARPIAALNALRFGDINHPKTKSLVNGVVSGIGGYGNSVGVPTIAGECNFHPSYNGNILVNAMVVGLADQNKIFYSAASIPGSKVVYFGSKTGRDGIHGATMASAEFDDDSEEKRPTVQVGDPFTEKLLIEACLELMKTDCILSIQDMGAAGLTCSSLEMAGKGGTGIELNLDNVPVREESMTPYEIMLSESQERMLMVIKEDKISEAEAIIRKWDLDFAPIGTITTTGRMILKFKGEIVADMPVAPLSDEAPLYERPFITNSNEIAIGKNIGAKNAREILEDLQEILASPDICSKQWIYRQYDQTVMNDTLYPSGGDAGVVRIHNSTKALAATSDCTPRYCYANPIEGGKQAVAEAYRNLSCVGAKPLAITNCLNFGNPEKPEIMGQIVGCLQGMNEACIELDFPIISGNVSLYNETNSQSILPTPTIGGVGLISDIKNFTKNHFKEAGDTIYLISSKDIKFDLGCSIYLREIEKLEQGFAPKVDLKLEKLNSQFIREAITDGLISACHDISDGGMLTATAEMAIYSNIGCEITLTSSNLTEMCFAEIQSSYIITTAFDAELKSKAEAMGVEIIKIGKTNGEKSFVFNNVSVTLTSLSDRFYNSFEEKVLSNNK